ncbi:MAG: CHASE domain-containing protein [Caenibius sp.]
MLNRITARRRFRRWLVRFPRAVPVALFLAIAAITTVSIYAIEKSEAQKRAANLQQVAQTVVSAVQQRVNDSASFLRAGAALIATLDRVNGPLFRQFVTELRLDTNTYGSDGIGWAPVIQRGQIADFNRRLALENGPAIAFHPAIASDQERATPVTYLAPQTIRNARAIGFDMYSERTRRAAMDAAAASTKPTASGKVVLEQEGRARQDGFLIYMPVFTGTGDARRLKGFIYSPFNAQTFLSSALKPENLDHVGVTLYDGSAKQGTLLAHSNLSEPAGQTTQASLDVAGRLWVVSVVAPRQSSLSFLSLLTLLFGLLVASLLMIVVRLLTQQAFEDQKLIELFEEQHAIRDSLTRELNHRVKNTLTNVLSLVALTRGRASDVSSFADDLAGRIRALSATHDLLTQSDWGCTPIRAVIEAELLPYVSDKVQRLEICGPRVELAPTEALSLGLALHELATNAAKYGSLSVEGGKVTISWKYHGDDRVDLLWSESGGPEVAKERKRGFGTELLERIVSNELGNKAELNFARSGVSCRLIVPVRKKSAFSIRQAGAPACSDTATQGQCPN